PLLEAVAPPLERRTQPRAGVDEPLRGETFRFDSLRPDRAPIEEGDEVARPAVGRPRFQRFTVEGQERVFVQVVGPGDEEGHLVRRVDSALGDVVELDQLVVGREPELEARRPQAEVGERFEFQPSLSGWPSMPSSAMSRRKNRAVVQSVTTRSFRRSSGSWSRWALRDTHQPGNL